MATAIILLILFVILLISLKSSLKHFKGEGGCCGGGGGNSDAKPQKKKLDGPVISTRTMVIGGMHCQNCSNHLMKKLNEIDGVSATVNLGKKKAVVKMDRVVDDSVLKNAVVDAGYSVESLN